MSINGIYGASSASTPNKSVQQLRDEYKDTINNAVKNKTPYGTSKSAVEPLVPNTNFVCDIYEKSGNYVPPKPSNENPSEIYYSVMQGYQESYQHDVKAYQEIFKGCDEDISYYEKLLNENTDPEQKELFEQLLERANTRKDSIAKQASEQLASKAEFAYKMIDLTSRVYKALAANTGNSEEAKKIERSESLINGKSDAIFKKISEMDFSVLIKDKQSMNTLFDNINEILSNSLTAWKKAH